MSTGLKVLTLVLTSMTPAEEVDSGVSRLVAGKAVGCWVEPGAVIVAEEECVFLIELALGKSVTCKLAAVSGTVPGVVDPEAWALSVVLKLSSRLGRIRGRELVPHCLLFVTAEGGAL